MAKKVKSMQLNKKTYLYVNELSSSGRKLVNNAEIQYMKVLGYNILWRKHLIHAVNNG